LHQVELNALRRIVDGFLVRPAGGRDPCTQVVEVRFGDIDRERADRSGVR
jgi:hypothetical protein